MGVNDPVPLHPAAGADAPSAPGLPERLDEALQGETASEVAGRLGITAATLSAWRRGRRRPNPEQLALLCRELQVSADWLLGLVGTKAEEEDSPSALLQAALDDLDFADELDQQQLVRALLGVLAENEQLKAQLKGARKRTNVEVANAVRDLQRKVLRGLLGGMDKAGIAKATREKILEAMDEEVEDGFRPGMGRSVG